MLVPTSTIDAPGNGAPSSSETLPVIVCCPKAIETAKSLLNTTIDGNVIVAFILWLSNSTNYLQAA